MVLPDESSSGFAVVSISVWDDETLTLTKNPGRKSSSKMNSLNIAILFLTRYACTVHDGYRRKTWVASLKAVSSCPSDSESDPSQQRDRSKEPHPDGGIVGKQQQHQVAEIETELFIAWIASTVLKCHKLQFIHNHFASEQRSSNCTESQVR